MLTSFTCQQVCSLRSSPTEWKLYFLKYLGLKPIKIFLLAFKKPVFSKGSVGHRYKNELVQLFRINLTRRQRLKETIDTLKGGTMHKTFTCQTYWWKLVRCHTLVQYHVLIKFICLNILGGLMLGKQLTLFHSKRTNSFCIYASLNGSGTQPPNVSQWQYACLLCIIKCLLVI